MTDEGDICSDILKALKILVTPLKTATDQSESFDLETALQKNISNLDKFLQENKTLSLTWENESLSSYITDTCLSWQFTYRCLKLLHLLQDSLKKAQVDFEKKEFKKDLKPSQAPPLSPDTLSFDQQKHILTALQFIICLSVCPNLQKGVGLPLSKRTGFNSILSTFLSENGSIHMGSGSIEDSYCKLLLCAKILVSCLDVPSIGVLVLSRHLNDVLAILIQLTYGVSKCKVESSQSNINLLISKSEEFCNAALKTVINNVRPSMLVRELLVLQGGPRTKKVQPGMLPPAPLWMRKGCGQLLTDILLKPDGVFHVIHGVAGNEVTNQVSVTNLSDWRKCEAAAKIIAHCPMQSASIDQYFERITPQLLSLLHAPDQQKSALYLRVCCSIIKEINQQHPTKTHQYILKPLLHPLLKCTNENIWNSKVNPPKTIISAEDELSECITDLHKIFVCGAEPLSTLTTSLQPTIQVLFSLLCFCSKGCTILKKYCHELLVAYLKCCEKSLALSFLIGLAYDWQFTNDEEVKKKQAHTDIVFTVGSNGGILAQYQPDQMKEDCDDTRVLCLNNIIKELQADGLAGDFLIALLKNLTDIIKSATYGESKETERPSELIPEEKKLLNIEEKGMEEMNNFQKRLLILNFLAQLSESLDPACMQDNRQVLEFVKATLERGVEVCKNTDDDIFALFESETITMAMGLLTALLTNSKQSTTEKDHEQMNELLPLLNELSNNHPESEIQDMATDLRIAIATRGIVLSELMKKKSDEKKSKENESKAKTNDMKKPLIEVIHEEKPQRTENPICSTSNPSPSSAQKVEDVREEKNSSILPTDLPKNSKLAEVFEELCHPEIPIRGHALLTLTKLIKAKDQDVLNHQQSVLEILESNLAHADTYLYLPSVNGLVAMANISPDQVTPRLAREFSRVTDSRTTVQADHKLKVGEALVKTSQSLGDMLPKYKGILLPAALCGVKDNDPLVRASSLSNLTEICRLLRFSLGSHIHEVVNCCGNILKSDKDDEVRKAAAQVFTHILQGVGKDAFQILDTGIKDIYRLLKSVYATETNTKVRDHLALGLNELDDIMRAALFPKQELTKRIRVLSAD